jgi:phage terminase large subunit-like protein
VSALEQLRYAPATEADYFADWCAEHLVHSTDRWAGQPLVLERWQRGFFEEAMACDRDGAPYWRSIGLVVARKNGKTAMLAALALYRLLEDDGQPEILLAAASDKQAGRLFDQVISYLRRNPGLSGRVHRREYLGEIVNIQTGGKIVRIPSSGETLDGFNPSLAICDELHAWTTPTRKRVWTSLTTSGGARSHAQVVTITTAGEAAARETSILGRLLSSNEAEGECEHQPGLTISRNHPARALVFNYSAPTSDPADVAAMKLANPASWITTNYLERQAANPELTDAEVLQLHGCVWAAGVDAWITGAEWEACAEPDASIPDGSPVYIGVDVGLVHDTTAVAVAWKREDDIVLVQATVFAAHPGAIADVHVPGGVVDLAQIERHIRDLGSRYQIREIAYDPRFFERSAQLLADTFLAFPLHQSSAAMADAYQAFYAAIKETRLRHTHKPVLTAHVMATAPQQTDRGWKVRKMRQHQRIDATVATVIAAWRAQQQHPTGHVWNWDN